LRQAKLELEGEVEVKGTFTVVAVVLASAALAAAALARPESGSFPPTWHIHDCTSGCVLPHAGVALCPPSRGVTAAADVPDPAASPDATDKAFLGGGRPPTADGVEANQPLREGVCMTSTTIIHLKSIAPGQPAPAGWTYLSTSGGYATYYSFTER
jgi:hypothetical protein